MDRDKSMFPGVSKTEFAAIWDEVKANHARLDACRLHNFAIDTTPDRPLGKKWKCTACGGVVDEIRKQWYERGLAHASGRPAPA